MRYRFRKLLARGARGSEELSRSHTQFQDRHGRRRFLKDEFYLRLKVGLRSRRSEIVASAEALTREFLNVVVGYGTRLLLPETHRRQPTNSQSERLTST